MRAGAVTFCVTRVSTCCTHTSGWAGCSCRPCCQVGVVETRLLEHGSCLGIFPTSLHPVPTTLSGGHGHCWGCLGHPCGVAQLCFLWWAHPVTAVLCAAGPAPMLSAWATCGELFCVLSHGRYQDMVGLLACQGRSLGVPLLFPQLSLILVLGRRALCWW